MKKLLINILVSVGATLVFLIIAELGVHFLSSNKIQSLIPANPVTKVFQACHIKDTGSSLSPSFYQLTDNPPGLWYELKPNVEGTVYGQPVKTNSLGMREHETTIEKPSNTFRIAILSDSATFGYGVKVEDRWSTILDGLLQDKVKSKKVEVLNFAVPGYNTKQEIIVLQDKILKFSPDLIVFGHSLNDIYGEGTVSLAPSPVTKFFMTKSALFNCFDSKLSTIKRIFVTDYTLNKPYTEMYATGSQTWEDYKKFFPEISGIVKAKKIPTLFVLLPVFKDLNENYEFADIDTRLTREIESSGMYVLNMSPTTGIKYDEASSYLVDPVKDYDHPTRKGHELIANAVYDKLVGIKVLPQ